ncbi:MAG: GIY-YIG nuclease family protein [Candidatus Aminicenantes bacterium]|nr:GIY-YIG nuclease family protein [Candidatus Aminicenantes bacterium]
MKKQSPPLKNLEVIVLDCQATHSDPKKGAVFEIGWAKTRASESIETNHFEKRIDSYLLKLPDSIEISNSIKRITGIQSEDLQSAFPQKTIWSKLLAVSQETAVQNDMPVCPAIIHYAGYETPYLKYFHKQFNPDIPFPFHIICSHQIIKRFFPGLPRKGLRASAGYFGLSIPETRRSLHHVRGTAFIWSQAVRLFETQEKLSSFDDLIKWMDTPSSTKDRSKPTRVYPLARNYRQDLPALPGIYRMLRSNGDLLYIGKATSLKHRVNSYFSQNGKHSEHILDMLSQAKSLSYSVTKTALEAALKESDEIKVFDPPYNIALRLSAGGPVFSTRDLRQFCQKPDNQYRIGPLPSKKHIEPLSFIMDFLNGKTLPLTSEILGKTLAAPEEFSPEPPLFLEGLKEFKKQVNNSGENPITFQTLMKMGTRLWKESLDKQVKKRLQVEMEKDTLVLKSKSLKKKKRDLAFHWTPGRLAKVLSHIIRIGTFQIRRSRWLYLLTESTLIWERREGEKNLKNLVTFKCGLPCFEDPLPISQQPIFPTGQKKAPLEKQNNFDIFTYDRMRILTAEIRRILEEKRTVQIQLGPKLLLKSEQLIEILKWV